MNTTYLCLCMSPAIDASVALDQAPKGEGEIFKNVKVVENAGGKTINVARWIRSRALSFAPSSTRSLSRPEPASSAGSLPCPESRALPRVICAGLLGEDNAALFEKEFAKYGIVDRMTRVKGATRRNEMITWPGGSFKLNQPAFADVDFDEDRFLEQLVEKADVVILSGSLPKCCSDDFYAKAVAAFKRQGAFVVLDASGEAMARALRGAGLRPDLIKPNDEECEALVGFKPKTAEEFKKATAMLKGEIATANGERLAGASRVIISAGGAGAWFDGEFVAAPQVAVVDTTAAGDTLLAEYCWQLRGGGAPAFAVAAGSAACTMPGSNPPPVGLVEELAEVAGNAESHFKCFIKHQK